MFALLITIHVLICVALILVILMQSSKGEGLAGAFGGTSLTGAVFGGRGAATFLSKTTTVLAIAFMLSCLALTFVSPARRATAFKSETKGEIQPQRQPVSMPAGQSDEEATPAGSQPSPVPPAPDKQPAPGGP